MTPKFDSLVEQLLAECGSDRVVVTEPVATEQPRTSSSLSVWAHIDAVSKLRKIVVELPKQLLTEARYTTVGNFTARKDGPHFNGDEYHAHVPLPGGYELSWGVSGQRRHPNKFPAIVPNNGRLAAATSLNVDPAKLESYISYDVDNNEFVILFEFRA
jgi:hypothetical protein